VAATTEQGSVSALPIISAAGEAVPVEVSRQEGSGASMSREGSSRDLT
jgi:hypothetical protein